MRILLEEWEADKRVLRDEIYSSLSIELEEILLAEIAWNSFNENHLFFLRQQIVKQIKTFLVNNLNAPTYLDSEKVLRQICSQQGILVERSEDTYSFSHLTLQEYLTAQHIDNHRYHEQIVKQHLADPQWREVFLLLAGLMPGGCDDLLEKMQEQANTFIFKGSKIVKLFKWAKEIVDDSDKSCKSALKRAVAFYHALDIALLISTFSITQYSFDHSVHPHYYSVMKRGSLLERDNIFIEDSERAESIAKDKATNLKDSIRLTQNQILAFIQSLDQDSLFRNIPSFHDKTFQSFLDMALKLKKLEIFAADSLNVLIPQLKTLSSENHRFFDDHVSKIWLEALRLDRMLLIFYPEIVENLNQYFYSNELIVCCRESALKVSPNAWKKIEEQMLTIEN